MILQGTHKYNINRKAISIDRNGNRSLIQKVITTTSLKEDGAAIT